MNPYINSYIKLIGLGFVMAAIRLLILLLLGQL